VFDHVDIAVGDIEASRAFYVRVDENSAETGGARLRRR